MIPGFSYRRRFSDLSEKEILALAISSEEDDASIYRSYAESLMKDYPDTAKIFLDMARKWSMKSLPCGRRTRRAISKRSSNGPWGLPATRSFHAD